MNVHVSVDIEGNEGAYPEGGTEIENTNLQRTWESATDVMQAAVEGASGSGATDMMFGGA